METKESDQAMEDDANLTDGTNTSNQDEAAKNKTATIVKPWRVVDGPKLTPINEEGNCSIKADVLILMIVNIDISILFY